MSRGGAGVLATLALASFLAIVSGCTTADVQNSVPQAEVTEAAVGNFKDIRYWADEPPGAFTRREQETIDLVRRIYGDSLRGRKKPITYLCISGGGSNGAYGAGFLVGWTEKGTRPKFDVVTGISTGSMIAPMAFLGAKYDAALREAYTTITTEDVATVQVLPALLGRTAGLADTAPLKRLIARYLTQSMLDEIAMESRKGRTLLIGTTNIEAQRQMIWNIGAIAESGQPGSLDLVHRIILASASIPGAFPPVDVAVTVGGKSYTEMHVDGGVTRQVFIYPPSYDPRKVDRAIGWKAERTLFIIRNNKITPEYAKVKPKVWDIAGRAVDTLIKFDGIGDLFRIYAVAKRDGISYHYTSIPTSFTMQSKSAFDKNYMGALFEAGRADALRSEPWHDAPPDL